MKKNLFGLTLLLSFTIISFAQTEPQAGNWKTWFISSGQDHRLMAPATYKKEIDQVISTQQKTDAAVLRDINYWNAGAPGYHWQQLIGAVWMTDPGYSGPISSMLVSVAIYDATIAAWDTKYAYSRPRPFTTDKRIKLIGVKPESPSYPCEYSVAAGAASTIIAHFFPSLTDSVNRMAERLMAAKIAAGVAFPSDTRAGFELGKKIALLELAHTKNYTIKESWDGKIPEGNGLWRGKSPMFPLAGKNKPVVLTRGDQFRPAAPPNFEKDMNELKNFKQTFSSKSNAYLYASQSSNDVILNTKIFEYNLHLNPPRAARLYAISAIGLYDCFIACWDAKFAYWGIRPDQYDTTYKPLLPTPPFPGYPSGHAAIGSVQSELNSYFFPAHKAVFQKRAKDGAESRFQGGIHFRTDNEVGLELGRQVARAIIERVKMDGADNGNAAVIKK